MTMPADWVNPNNVDFGYEETIWSNDVTIGFFNRHTESQKLTNQRVILNGSGTLLSDLDDIITMGSHSEGTGQNMRVRGMGGVSYGMGNYRGKSVGSVAFIYHGQPIMFNNVSDPAGLVRLAKAARKRMLALIKATQKQAEEKIKSKYVPEKEESRNSVPITLNIKLDKVNDVDLSSRNSDNPDPTVLTEERIKDINKKRLENGDITDNSPFCPKDGLINSGAFCVLCGTRLTVRNLGSLKMAHGEIGVSYCPKDGMIHQGEFCKFCLICGTSLIVPDPLSNASFSVCNKCGNNNPRGSRFCNGCGFTLT